MNPPPRSYYKRCIVPECESTTTKTPNKLFITVPKINRQLRKKWLDLARSSVAESLPIKATVFFCEDHFDLPNDMENYIQFKIMGKVSQVRMKPGCTPTKFACQKDRRKRTCGGAERPCAVKRQRKMIIAECLKESQENELNLSSQDISNTNPDNETVEENAPEVLIKQTANKCVQASLRPKCRSKAVQTKLKDALSPFKAKGSNLQETCSYCSMAIPPNWALARCVQCAEGALFCARCLHNAHAHTTHALMQLPDTKTYRILEGIFRQLHLDVNEMLFKNDEDEEMDYVPIKHEPLVELLELPDFPDTRSSQDDFSTSHTDPLQREEYPLTPTNTFNPDEMVIVKNELVEPNISDCENKDTIQHSPTKTKQSSESHGNIRTLKTRKRVEGPTSHARQRSGATELPQCHKETYKQDPLTNDDDEAHDALASKRTVHGVVQDSLPGSLECQRSERLSHSQPRARYRPPQVQSVQGGHP